MQSDRPSATAWRVALRRAMHQLVDHPRVLEDPVAVAMVGEESVRKFMAGESAAPAAMRTISRALRAFVVARSRFAEDQLAAAVARGVRCYVILGAGLDTFAYRNPFAAQGLRVIEVDHPATQNWKRHLLERAGIAIPASVRFLPVDFEKQSLAMAMNSERFEGDAPVCFSWLGVVPYLTMAGFAQTLALLGKHPGGTELVFDYAASQESMTYRERAALAHLASRVAAIGEPFRLFMSEKALQEEVYPAGFKTLKILTAREINGHYFSGRTDALQVTGSLARLAHAAI